MLKYLIMYVLVLLPGGWIYGQDTCDEIIEGVVLDRDTKEPIEFVTVQIEGTSKGSITDVDGHFLLTNVCGNEVDLLVSFVGYKQLKHHHDVHHPHPTIYLAHDNLMLESIVVEAEFEEFQVTTMHQEGLSSHDMALARTESFGDALGRISGVTTLSTGQNIVKPMIHGLHSNRVLIINNDVRHEFQNWGADHAPEIDPGQADNLQVVKGAATVRFGPDALGGVILVKPDPLDLGTRVYGDAGLTGQTNGRAGQGRITIGKGFDTWSVRGQAKWTKQGDLHAPDYSLTNTGKEENSLSAAVRYHAHVMDVDAYVSRVDQTLGILRGSVNGNLEDLARAVESDRPLNTEGFGYAINNPRQETRHDLGKLKATFSMKDHSFDVRYGIQKNVRKEFDVRRGTNNQVPSINLELVSHSLDLDWHHWIENGLSGSVGLQVLFQNNANVPGTNTIPLVPNYDLFRLGMFVNESLERNDWMYEAGIRYDLQYSTIIGRDIYNEIFENHLQFGNFTATLGVSKNMGTYATFRTNLGTAWRPPNVSELYSYGKHQSSIEYGLWRYEVDEEGNISTGRVLTQNDKNVSPEVGIKWISSYTYSRASWEWDAVAYINLIKNYIYTRPSGITSTVRGAFPYFLYDQNDALFWGLDLTGKHEISSQLTGQVKAAYVWAEDITNQDYFVEIPPLQVGCGLYWTVLEHEQNSITFDTDLTYTFRQFRSPRVITVRELIEAEETGEDLFENDQSTFDIVAPPDGYLLVGAGFSASLGEFDITLHASNLLNNSYRVYTDRLRYFADQPGFNLMLSLSYHW